MSTADFYIDPYIVDELLAMSSSQESNDFDPSPSLAELENGDQTKGAENMDAQWARAPSAPICDVEPISSSGENVQDAQRQPPSNEPSVKR